MKTELDINKLIEKAQELCHNGKIEFAQSGEVEVQEMESESGNKYLLTVKLSYTQSHPAQFGEKKEGE